MVKNSGQSRIFKEIRDILLNEGYAKGDVLPTEAMLTERFSCSRRSVREALKQLQTLGLVSIQRGIGTFVGPLTVTPLFESVAVGTVLPSRDNPRAFQEVLETRIALDIGMAALICEKFKGRRDPELDAIVDGMVALAERGDRFLDLDKAFHDRLQGAVGNGFALDLVMNFWDVFGKMDLDGKIGMVVDPKEVAISHRALLEAAYAGDLEAYQQALEWHYEGSRKQAETFAEQSLDAPNGRWAGVESAWV